MTTIKLKLTPAQSAILTHAVKHTDGQIVWFPGNIKGGARQKVLGSLLKHALISQLADDWVVTAEGYDALGKPRPATIATSNGVAPEVKDTSAIKPTRTRDNSKQAQVVAMLKRSEGATIPQICAVTAWQAHTVRGAFAGAFKKKLGLTITSTKDADGERIYRVA
jgi:hypothetical protein